MPPDLKVNPSKLVTPTPEKGLDLVCHLKPIPFVQQMEVDIPLRREKAIQISPTMGHVPCLGAKCTLWDAKLNEGKGGCLDVESRRATIENVEQMKKLNAAIDLIDGLMRQADSHQ